MKFRPVCLLLLPFLTVRWLTAAPADGAKPENAGKAAEPAAVEPAGKTPEPVVKDGVVEISGRKIPYRVTTGKIALKGEDGKARASIFHVSYERSDVKDPAGRPVLFAFNGGPGSSAVWLHIGVLGPKIVRLPGDGTQPPQPPVRVVDNPLSILDACDLVFVDPVSTGYSRSEGEAKPGEFHGFREDIESCGDFVRRWVTERGRWASPKFLLGESYGGVRVAGLAQHLQARFGMSLNGVVLLSSLLDFATLNAAEGSDLPYQVFLPAFTGVAHFHGRIQGNRDALVRESAAFAFGDYALALFKGHELDDERRKATAARLAALTGLPAELWEKHNLRVDPGVFRAELLRHEDKVIGRFDGRVAWDATDRTLRVASYDPSYSLAYGAFSTAMMDYLGRELGYKEDQPYEILTGKVHPWRWDADNELLNVGDSLATAMRDNPRLKLLVMNGYTDLATPPEGVAHSLRHLPGLTASARANIRSTWYDGGHMFYLNPPDLEKSRVDLVEFISWAAP